MKYKNIKFTILIIAFNILFGGCATKISVYEPFEDVQKDEILNNKIHFIKEFNVDIDYYGKSLWKKLYVINEYNKKGDIIMETYPKYQRRMAPAPTEPLIEPNPFLSSESGDYDNAMTTTNMLTGQSETISYEYNDDEQLVSEVSIYGTKHTFKYDNYNNVVEECGSSDLGETYCNYTEYTYDEDAKINIKTVTFGARSQDYKDSLHKEKLKYIYDDKKRLISDGKYTKTYNTNNQLVKFVDGPNSKPEHSIYDFYYNKEGRKMKILETRKWDVYDSRKKKIVDIAYFKSYFYYDNNGLLKQKKELDHNNKLISLKDFEYVFY